MEISFKNPLPLLSLNFLGIGFDVSYGVTENEKAICLVVNFVFGSWHKYWKI